MEKGKSISVETSCLFSRTENIQKSCTDICSREGLCTIFRVPKKMCQGDKQNDYHPMIVSIGPYHRGVKSLQAMENHKWRYLSDYIKRNPTIGLDTYFKAVEEMEAEARLSYSECIDLASHEFVEMLVLDGCFIIEFFLKHQTKQLHHTIIYRDMLLLENQIPFFILQCLFDLAEIPPDVCDDFPSTVAFRLFPWNETLIPKVNPIHHFLHFLHSCVVSHYKKELSNRSKKHSEKDHSLHLPAEKKKAQFFAMEGELYQGLLTSLPQEAPVVNGMAQAARFLVYEVNNQSSIEQFALRLRDKEENDQSSITQLLSGRDYYPSDDGDDIRQAAESVDEAVITRQIAVAVPEQIAVPIYEGDNQTSIDVDVVIKQAAVSVDDESNQSSEQRLLPNPIPCATLLFQAGIKFQKKDSSSFLDIEFSKADGVMKIPTLVIYDETRSHFRNLIALEQWYPNSENHISAYAVFLDYLLDGPADVALLTNEGIIENKLSSDKDLAKLLNDLCEHVVLNLKKSYLRGLFEELKKYTKRRWPRWGKKWVKSYFTNPWMLIASSIASLLFFFTAVMTAISILNDFGLPSWL